MNFSKIFSQIIIVAGALSIIFAVYVAFAPKTVNNGVHNNIVNAPPVPSVSNSVAISGKTATVSPIPTAELLAENALRYIINSGQSQKSFDKEAGKNQTVFSILEGLSKTDNLEMKYNNNYSFGVFVESIDNIANGEDGKYWQYYVNGELGQVAADKQEIKAGDKVEWRFEKVPEM